MKKLPARITKLFVITVITIVLFEVAVRAFLPQYAPAQQMRLQRLSPDAPPLGPFNKVLRQHKNTGDYDVTVRFNQHGFRDDKDITNITADDYAVVGDSFSFGWGVEEHQRYSNLLQIYLDPDIYNIAMPGTNILTYQKILAYSRTLGADIKRIIIGLCMENDLVDYVEVAKYEATSESAQPHFFNVQSLKYLLHKHSAAYALTTLAINTQPDLRDMFIQLGLIIPNLEGIKYNKNNPAILQQSLMELQKLAQNYETVIMIIPSRGLWVGENQSTEQAVHKMLVKELQALNMIVIDLRHVMEKTGRPMQYHFKNDGHWNPAGHQLAAQYIARQLR